MDRYQTILQLAEQQGLIRLREVEEIGIPRMYLQRLYQTGQLERVSRGLYGLPNRLLTEHANLIEVSKRVPKAVICLISALQFHQVGTQLPWQVWIALEGQTWEPHLEYPALNITRMTGASAHYGIEIHAVEKSQVYVYSLAKTLADCFKFRNKVGLEVCLEALKDSLHHKKTTVDAIWQAAKICRVSNVMRPYLEAV
jgi:predicted transcriptional regulator of viral defense system